VRLTVIGCSGSFPGPDSPASAYLLTADDASGRTWRVLLDLGNGALGPLQRHTRLADVDAVLLSHLHPDHFMDLCGFYVALKYDPDGGKDDRLVVHGPRGTARRLAEAYGLPRHPGMDAEMDVHTWQDAEPVRVGPFLVTPRRVLHPVEAYGMRVEGPGADGGTRVLAYTGDTDDCPELDEIAQDADLLLAEAAFHEGRDDDVRGIHLTGRRAGEVATRARVRRMVLTHVPPWNDPQLTLVEARGAYDGPIELARQDLVLDV
jgi:ribonuclease BN (tRNA processing enzyme)